MSHWYMKNLGNGLDAHGQTTQMQKAFMATFMLLPHGSDQAMFSRYDLQADNVEIYFTPAAAGTALQFGATPCEKPTPNRYRMGLLVGEGDALQVHFPNQRQG